MSTSADAERLNRDGALTGPATESAHDACGPAFLSDLALVRLREGLRAQREQQLGLPFSETEGASSRLESSESWQDWHNVVSHIEPIAENPPLAPNADESAIQVPEPAHSRSPPRRKVGLRAFLLLASAVVLGLWLTSQTMGLDDHSPSDALGFNRSSRQANPESRQPITGALSPSATEPSAPLAPALLHENKPEALGAVTPIVTEAPVPSTDKSLEPHGAAAPAVIETGVPSSGQSLDAHGPATSTSPDAPAASSKQPIEAQEHAAPAAPKTIYRHHSISRSLKRRELAHRRLTLHRPRASLTIELRKHGQPVVRGSSS